MPTDQIESTRVICEGGLNTNESTLILSSESPGAATDLVNYESAISGGYRRINGFIKYSADFPEVGVGVASGKILWVGIFRNTQNGDNETIAARADLDGLNYKFYLYDSATGWLPITHPVRPMSTIDAQVIKIRHVEFNFGGGNNLIFVDGVNPALWYDGTDWVELLSTNAGGPAAPGGNQIIDAPSLVTTFKGHIFLSGDATPSGMARVVHSAPLQPDTWTFAGGGGQLFPGFEPIQIRPFRDELYVFGKASIKKAIADLASGFVLQDVTDDLGCLAADSVLEVGGNLIFLSQDGIRPVAGTDKLNDVELGLLSQDIQPIIDNMLLSVDFNSLDGVVIRAKTQFRYTWGNEDVDTPESLGLIGCVRTNKRTGKTWEYAELRGIRTSCVWSGLVDDREIVLHGDYNGIVYQDERGNSFDGGNIVSVYATPFLDIGATDVRKLLREINTFITAEGSATMFLALNFDWDMDSNILTPANYQGLVASGSTFYDSLDAVYDSSATIYGGQTRSVLQNKLQGSCFSVKFTYVNSGTDAPYTIQGFIPEYSVKGRN